MNDASVLGQVALGYCPMIDRQRSIMATRLTVFPLRPDSAPYAGELLQALGEVWPAEGARAGAEHRQRRPVARQPCG